MPDPLGSASLTWRAQFFNGLRGFLRPLVLIRVGLCLIFLLRHEAPVAQLLDFERDIWGAGPMYGSSSLAPQQPAFHQPLIVGFDKLLPFSDWLCRLRLVLVLLLLFGIYPRINALLLALVSFSLFAADAFHYLHHIWILYFAVGLLAFSHEVPPERHAGQVPLALLLIRAQVVVVYVMAGLAKCSPAWLSGSTIKALMAEGFVSGPLAELGASRLGSQGLAWLAAGTELLAGGLLFFAPTRLFGVLLALVLHCVIHATMNVSTFGGTMLVLLCAFLPLSRPRSAPHSIADPLLNRRWLSACLLLLLLPLVSRLMGSSIGSFSMFTRLVHYQLDINVNGQSIPRSKLVPHLGLDGARIVRLASGRGVGEANVEILGRALPQLTSFLCQLDPQAHKVQLALGTQRIEGGPWTTRTRRVNCKTGEGDSSSCLGDPRGPQEP